MSSRKAVAKALNILLAIGIISFLVFIFFAAYGAKAKVLEKEIETNIKGLSQNTILITLMNVKTDQGKTVAEHIIAREGTIAATEISLQLKKFYIFC